MPEKVSKQSVSYRTGDPSGRHCGNCDMWQPSVLGIGQCELVRGVIVDQAVCDKWVKDKK